MNKEIKEKWVTALRSGKYKQSKHSLHTKEGFCCLGVLCDILGEKWKQHPLYGNYIGILDTNPSDSADEPTSWASYLPPYLMERTGIGDREQDVLARMNDQGESFEQIADYVKSL